MQFNDITVPPSSAADNIRQTCQEYFSKDNFRYIVTVIRDSTPRALALPLHATGFVGAFGAYSVAATLAGFTQSAHANVLVLGLLLAVYSGAELVLTPVFRRVATRVGARPVLIGGLAAFALVSAASIGAGNPVEVGLARCGQGAAAAAFSPAAAMLLARLPPAAEIDRHLRHHSTWKQLGYAAGPVLGFALVRVGGYPLLFAALAATAAAAGCWAALTVPAPQASTTSGQADPARHRTRGPTRSVIASLAGSSGALVVGIGFLPILGDRDGLTAPAIAALISALAATAVALQPLVRRAHDSGRLPDRTGAAAGLLVTGTGFVGAALLPGGAGLVCAALVIAVGVSITAPLTFRYLARTDRREHSMRAAECGYQLGATAAPLVVGALAVATTLGTGLLAMTVALAVAANGLATAARAR